VDRRIGLIVGALFLAYCCPASALDENEMKSMLVAAQSRHACPSIHFDVRWLPDYSSCHQSDAGEASVCMNEQDRIAHLAWQINKIYDDCHPDQNARSDEKAREIPKGQERRDSGDQTDTGDAAADTDAAESDEMKKTIEANEKRKHNAKVAENKRANRPSTACRQNINSCVQWAHSMPESVARTNCEVYCRNMQIEKCNPNSATLLQTAQVCNAANDHVRAEVERARREEQQAQQQRAQQQRALDEARRRADEQNSRKSSDPCYRAYDPNYNFCD
jgi:hypothetical protein